MFARRGGVFKNTITKTDLVPERAMRVACELEDQLVV